MAITLKQALATTLTLSILTAIALFEPHLEFAIFDIMETLHLPAPLLGTLAIYAELALIATTIVLAAILVFRPKTPSQ